MLHRTLRSPTTFPRCNRLTSPTTFPSLSFLFPGDCIASTFPLSRRDGPVSEVLLLDCAPEPRIVTVQHRRPAPHVVRLQGATIKVWTAATLTSQKPLFTLHDVIKHLQMEDGRLFLWHIADDAIITVRCHPEAPEAEAAECRRWTEHPSLVASVLDPVALTLTPVPLDSAFGRGAAPHEWMDMCSGAVASASVVLTQHRVSVRLLDIATGECFKESQCAMPAMPGDAVPPMHEDTAVMLMSRNSDTEYQVIAAAALFDCRVFRWRLRDEWLTPAARAKASERQRRRREAAQAAQQQQQQRQQQGDEAGSVSGGFINGGGEQPFVGHQAAGGNNDLGQGVAQDNMHDAVYTEAEESGEFVLHHIFTTPDAEPIVDLSISTAAHRIYVLGMENLFILGEDGRPQMTCSMVQWRGVHSSVAEMGPYDVGAFSWPLPNSTRAAFYLDVTNSLFVADFKPPMPWCPPGSSNGKPWNVLALLGMHYSHMSFVFEEK